MDGIGPPLVTPFTEAGRVDHDNLISLLDRLESAGIDFVVPCGSTSEAPMLSSSERKAVIETVASTASVPVIAGTGHPSLAETIETTAFAATAGADAALVVTPYYYNHDQDALTAYYGELADEVSIPIYLYSVPKFTGVTLEPPTIERLATHPNIHGIKDSSGSLKRVIRTLERTESAEFDVMVGATSLVATALSHGCSGAILALANLTPAELAEAYSAHQAGAIEDARIAIANLVDLNHAITNTYGIPGLKWAMRYRDMPAGHPRAPFQGLDAAQQRELKQLIDGH